MPDYGHDLAFGTFITPGNANPEHTVALAQLTEAAGLEYATFQDHPYQPAFLDTWTLLSWVAAQTTTLKVAPNVLNLPLRQPAVVARSAASLDLLSGGRFELGLGAGGFWDAIAAMGGPRRTPGEGVDALTEAIEIIRGIWDTSTRGGVRVRGNHYEVTGAKRGPEPAHDIEIWLGAYKPRMLRLTGRSADGWLPSQMYMDFSDAPAMNQSIDDAATKAGRDPREIRRLLNIQGRFGSGDGFLEGSPEKWIEDLLPLVTDLGFSTFFMAGDDPDAIELFGKEVAPGLRERVAEHRASAGTPTGRARGPKALEQRRDGIDYDAVPENLRGSAVEPGDKDYGTVRSTYLRTGSPGLVLRPSNAHGVQEAVRYARDQHVSLTVRSGGHGISGRSTNDGGVVIDVGALDEVTILDADTGRVRLGPGARWGEVARDLAEHGLGMSSGDYGDVGVGGLATAGGIGFLGRRHGLTIDHVTAAEIVLADGTLVRADAETHPDLLWAIRGAGGNFGIVTAFELDAYPVGDVVFSRALFAADEGMLTNWANTVESSPRDLTSFLTVVDQGGAQLAQAYTVLASDDTEAAVEALTPLLNVGQVLDHSAQLVPYGAIVSPGDPIHRGGREPAIRGGLLTHVTPEAAKGLLDLVRSGDVSFLQLRSVGGAVNDVDPQATAYAHRHQNFALTAVGAGTIELMNERWDTTMGPHIDGLYMSFDTDRRPERLNDAFPGETLTRLRELKAVYDPGNVFDQNFPIPPAARTDDSGPELVRDLEDLVGGHAGGSGVVA
jgi:alkanesulfonate monooxygenase SsuD/methylene tetrahydromethanopterin reductase-like flavin-dependent oxidoreductase (luciferase family)/FAD/FMN-containing dehydrogenase